MAQARARGADTVFYALLALTTLVFVADILIVFLRAPVEARMGIVQKIFYFHVPSAYAMYLGAAACFFGSIGYLVRGTDSADAIPRAGAGAAVAFGARVVANVTLCG